MDFLRFTIASLMLLFSGQSMALFMPEGFSIKAEVEPASDDGCGVVPAARDTTAF